MKRFLALTLALLIVMTMAACGGSGGKAADPNTLVVWHDKEAAVIEALQAYLDKALPDITVRFEKKTSLTDSLKLVGNDPSSAPDLFVFAHDKIGVFAEMGILTPVTELISQSELSGYLPMTLRPTTAACTSFLCILKRCCLCIIDAICRMKRCRPPQKNCWRI